MESPPPDYVPNRHGPPGTCEIVSDDDDETWIESTDDDDSDDDDSDDDDSEYELPRHRLYKRRFLGMDLRISFTPYQLTYVFVGAVIMYCLNAVIWAVY